MTNNKFNPSRYLSSVNGKEYLEVKWRIVWFRLERADWGIETEIVNSAQGAAQVKATIRNAEGRIMAQAHKMETKVGFGDYLEKAETGAIGRALALCGYGTQFTGDELAEGERIVDSPISGKEMIEGHASGELATFRQVEKLGQLLETRIKLRTKGEKIEWIKDAFGIEVSDLTELTKHDASMVIKKLIGDEDPNVSIN